MVYTASDFAVLMHSFLQDFIEKNSNPWAREDKYP